MGTASKVWLMEHLTYGLVILFHVVVVTVLAIVAVRLGRTLTKRLSALLKKGETDKGREQRVATLTQLVNATTGVIVWTIAGLMVLRELGIAIGPLLAGAGIAGVAIGFGAQTLVKDFLTGAFILAEDLFRVGDVIAVAGFTGCVEGMTLRTVQLRDAEGVVHTLPYSTITVVSNRTRDWRSSNLDIGIGYGDDIDKAMGTVEETLMALYSDEQWSGRFVEPPVVDGVQELGSSAVILRARLKTQPSDLWAVRREALKRVKAAFDRAGITMPFPQREIRVRTEDVKPTSAVKRVRGKRKTK